MGNYRGNVDKVMADANKIVQQLRKNKTTIKKLRAKYHCGYPAIMRAILSQISFEEWKQLRHKRLARGGIKTRFRKGQPAWNKGLHYNPGGRSVETRFKPDQIRGAAARNYRAVGIITIRHDSLFRRQNRSKLIRKDGTIRKGKLRRWIKIKDTGPPQYCWIPYARWLWEQKHGPVLPGHFVVHKDGNQMNDAPDNLILATRKSNLARNQELNPEAVAKGYIRAGKSRRKNTKARKQMRELHRHENIRWDCCGCGAEYISIEQPQRCVKCGFCSFEKIKYRKTG